MQRAAGAGSRGGKPNLAAVRSPGQTLRTDKDRCSQRGLLAGLIDNCYRTGVVTRKRMVDERHLRAIGRNARMADPSGGFVKYFPERMLQTNLSADATDHGDRAVRGPVRKFRAFRDGTRRSASLR